MLDVDPKVFRPTTHVGEAQLRRPPDPEPRSTPPDSTPFVQRTKSVEPSELLDTVRAQEVVDQHETSSYCMGLSAMLQVPFRQLARWNEYVVARQNVVVGQLTELKPSYWSPMPSLVGVTFGDGADQRPFEWMRERPAMSTAMHQVAVGHEMSLGLPLMGLTTPASDHVRPAPSTAAATPSGPVACGIPGECDVTVADVGVGATVVRLARGHRRGAA